MPIIIFLTPLQRGRFFVNWQKRCWINLILQWFVGTDSVLDKLVLYVQKHHMDNVVFIPYQ